MVMENKIDRLSELPKPVVEHILSFIPLKQILQLTMLSKTWQNVWTLFPILKLDESTLFPVPKLDESTLFPIHRKLDESLVWSKKFNYFVERTLLSHCRQNISIRRFEIRILDNIDDDEWYCACVNRWIGYAIESNVKELNIFASPKNYYKVPESVLVARSVTELTLWGCDLESFQSDHGIHLSSLKKLVLGEVYNVNDQIVKTLIAGSPVVEEIKFARCDGLRNIHVLGLPKLMKIVVAYNEELDSVKIEASNLESLLIELCKPCQINLLPCENLKKLELYSATMTDEWLHDVLSKHLVIESLTLLRCDMLKRIKISSDRMKSLAFYRCSELVEVNIVTPNLHSLEYYGYVISFSSNTSSLSEVRLRFLNCSFDWIYDVEKIEFLTKLNHLKLLTWRAHYAKCDYSKKMRKGQLSPLYNVKQLKLEAVFTPTRYEINKLVNALLWISPLVEDLSIEWQDEATSQFIDISFKFSYESSFDKGVDRNCCKFLTVSCWRHCLKTVKIEDFSKSADMETLKKYFFKNAKKLSSFQYFKEFELLKRGQNQISL